MTLKERCFLKWNVNMETDISAANTKSYIFLDLKVVCSEVRMLSRLISQMTILWSILLSTYILWNSLLKMCCLHINIFTIWMTDKNSFCFSASKCKYKILNTIVVIK